MRQQQPATLKFDQNGFGRLLGAGDPRCLQYSARLTSKLSRRRLEEICVTTGGNRAQQQRRYVNGPEARHPFEPRKPLRNVFIRGQLAATVAR